MDMIILTLPRTLRVITAIINMSIESGVFPDLWKNAVIQPLPKVNSPKEYKDLRPISILPFLSKILEKVVCKQMVNYLNANNILPLKQSGFRIGRSTATALLDVVDDILEGREVGEASILVLLDYSRAFDTVNSSLLMAKLTYYGFDAPSLKWFSSYLSGRSQKVVVTRSDGSKHFSKDTPINKGVPQGSILGPILFILYTADLPKCIKNNEYHLYADDLQIYRTFESCNTKVAVNNINDDLIRVDEWSLANGLVLNPNKTKFLIMGTKNQISDINAHSLDIKLKDVLIERVTETRNLGVLMDSDLKFENHVLATVKSCYYRLKILYRLREYLSVESRIYLCEALVLSKLNYADVVIGNCLLARTKKLIQRVQNSCARFCFPIPRRAHITPYLNKSDLLNMDSRRTFHLAVLLYNIVKNKSPSYLFNKLEFSHRVRVPDRLICPRHKTAAFRGSFKYAATHCWNNIPPPIRNVCSVQSFKCNFKKYILDIQKR
jgi:hypothetical protein